MALTDKLTAIADSIRAKTGSTAQLTLDEMAATITTIETDSTNFEIVGGTTQPTSPSENTIWINTSTTIGEYQFAVTQPTKRADGAALQTGDVWIKTALASAISFNALKKNGIYIYCNTAHQYNGSSWVEKTAKYYIDGTWKTTAYYLIDLSTSTYVGSWTYDSNSFGQTVTQTSSGLKFYKYAYQAGVTFAGQTGVDVTNYSTMVITISEVSGSSTTTNPYDTANRIGLSTTKTASADSYSDYSKYAIYTLTNRKTGTYTIDISSLSGVHYPRIYLISQSSDASITISELYFK